MKKVQKALITQGDKYLILLRSEEEENFPLYWDFPGGGLEAWEDRLLGLEREVFEETWLVVKAMEMVTAYYLNHYGKDYEFALFSTEILENNWVTLSSEHLEYKWVTIPELSNMEKIEPYMEEYLKEFCWN